MLITRRRALEALSGAAALMGTAMVSGCATDQGSEASSGEPTTGQEASAQEARDALAWWQDTVVFELYPKSFLDTVGQGTGTLAGATEKLDYLACLGVGAIWLTPFYKSPMKDNGYDIEDYYAIDPSFGTMADMDTLIDQAAARDIRIVSDLVMNHTSDQNAWFVESASSKDNPKADWYIWKDAKEDGSAPTNWRSIFGGSAWTWNETRQQYYLHTFADFQPDLNWECAQMREELYRMARFWLDKGIGGFRIDAIPYIKKPDYVDGEPDGEPDGLSPIHNAIANTDGILDFLREFKQEVMAGTDAFTVAEANGVGPDQLKYWVGDEGVFDMVFEFSHMLVPTGGKEVWYEAGDWKLSDFTKALNQSQAATATNGWYPIYFENHDQPRSVSNLTPKVADKRGAAKVLGTVLMTMRGTPFVYQGEELGYQNVAWDSIDDYNDVSSHNQYQMAIDAGLSEEKAMAAVHAFSRDNARTPMQWDDTNNAGFTTGDPWLPVHDDYKTQNVVVEEADEDSVLAWYRSLSALRDRLPQLVAGDFTPLVEGSEELYAFERSCAGKKAVTLANFTEGEVGYDPKLVEGLEVVLSTNASSEAGVLAPLETVVFATPEQ